MLIQGTNIPLKIVFDQSVADIPELVVSLWKNRKLLKQWNKEDMNVEDDTVTLPLTEDETKDFPPGPSTVEAKGLTAFGQTIFWDEYNVNIHPRRDHDISLIDE